MFNLETYRMHETRVFRDVIHGYITVEYLPIWQLINTATFQRLRRIHQLGGSCMVFPSAEHSRFGHSLGVYEIVRKMTAIPEIAAHINDYEKLSVMIAGLLHDIGHGPYSHCFESVMAMHHEEMTKRIILEDSDIHHVLTHIAASLPEDVVAIIDKSHNNTILVQMVSSQLDADRMDYLLRDSYFAGVTYGQFDMERILRTLRVRNHRIVYKESGLQAIEDYILARYYMYWQVYFHPVGRSYEHLLHSIMTRLRDLYRQHYAFRTDIQELIPLLDNRYTIEEYIQYDEIIIGYYLRCFMKEDDAILSDLSARFINRHLLKFQTLQDADALAHIQAVSAKHGYDPYYYVADDDAMQLLYIDDHVGNYVSEIEILEENGHICTLPEKSEIVNAIINGKPKQDKKVFFVKEIRALI